jgi:fructose-1,6-bisphosphatase I
MKGMTLNRHILQQETKHPEMRGELSLLLSQMGFVAKILAREMRRAALVGQLGLVGERNPTGDAQKKLDVFANETVVEAFTEIGLMAAIASEELDQVKHISCGNDARYILCADPLDGSSNTDINGTLMALSGPFSVFIGVPQPAHARPCRRCCARARRCSRQAMCFTAPAQC